MMILICIEGNIYEISDFVKRHPGEGINNLYIRDYKYTDVTELFEKYHNSNTSYEKLISARNNGYDKESGIHYVCSNFFRKKKNT